MHSERFETLKSQVWEMLSNLSYHVGIMHLDGVSVLSSLLSSKRGLNSDICKCAGLLHDLWLYCFIPFDADKQEKKQHGYKGSILARDILTQNGLYSEEEITVICEMVYNHNDKDIIHDEYSELLKDADALQHYLNGSSYDKQYKYFGRDKKILEEFDLQ